MCVCGRHSVIGLGGREREIRNEKRSSPFSHIHRKNTIMAPGAPRGRQVAGKLLPRPRDIGRSSLWAPSLLRAFLCLSVCVCGTKKKRELKIFDTSKAPMLIPRCSCSNRNDLRISMKYTCGCHPFIKSRCGGNCVATSACPRTCVASLSCVVMILEFGFCRMSSHCIIAGRAIRFASMCILMFDISIYLRSSSNGAPLFFFFF